MKSPFIFKVKVIKLIVYHIHFEKIGGAHNGVPTFLDLLFLVVGSIWLKIDLDEFLNVLNYFCKVEVNVWFEKLKNHLSSFLKN